MIVVLSGGVGGARLCAGLMQVFAPDEMLIVVNNGDDFDHWGLRVCPDLDTVMYTLSGRVDEQQGWGVRQETWQVLEAVVAAGGEGWFRIGDGDLATHLIRTEQLRAGRSLSSVTQALMHTHGIRHQVVPSTDDHHRSLVLTDAGLLDFQTYFVRRRCEPRLLGLQMDSRAADGGPARPAQAWAAAMMRQVDAVLVCPSNPILSIQPMLTLLGVRDWLRRRSFPVLAVSPFIGGGAIKGPAAKIFGECGLETSVRGLAGWYEGLVDGWLVDSNDAEEVRTLAGLGFQARVANTWLDSDERRRGVAGALKEWLRDGVALAPGREGGRIAVDRT